MWPCLSLPHVRWGVSNEAPLYLRPSVFTSWGCSIVVWLLKLPTMLLKYLFFCWVFIIVLQNIVIYALPIHVPFGDFLIPSPAALFVKYALVKGTGGIHSSRCRQARGVRESHHTGLGVLTARVTPRSPAAHRARLFHAAGLSADGLPRRASRVGHPQEAPGWPRTSCLVTVGPFCASPVPCGGSHPLHSARLCT